MLEGAVHKPGFLAHAAWAAAKHHEAIIAAGRLETSLAPEVDSKAQPDTGQENVSNKAWYHVAQDEDQKSWPKGTKTCSMLSLGSADQTAAATTQAILICTTAEDTVKVDSGGPSRQPLVFDTIVDAHGNEKLQDTPNEVSQHIHPDPGIETCP